MCLDHISLMKDVLDVMGDLVISLCNILVCLIQGHAYDRSSFVQEKCMAKYQLDCLIV